jgi:hypothetical protein
MFVLGQSLVAELAKIIKSEGGMHISNGRRSVRSRAHTYRSVGARDIDGRVIFVPNTLNMEGFMRLKGKGLVLAAYCIKSADCPETRFSTRCKPSCDLCDMSTVQRESKRINFDFRIATDHTSVLRLLENNEHKYGRLIAIACPYTIGKIALTVHRRFNLSGFVIPLRGNVCTSKKKYEYGIRGEKRARTKMDLEIFLEVVERIMRTEPQTIALSE